ncbi:MAG TPA: hypothetical protein VGG62_12230 [Terracidiphilus sp.]|jgi:hypothetical protein
MRETVYFGDTTRMNFLHCPACGAEIDAATNISLEREHVRPSPGAFTVCGFCAVLLVFEENITAVAALRLRRASDADKEDLRARNPKTAKMLDTVQAAMRKLVADKKRRMG